jgi:hypothetical protein
MMRWVERRDWSLLNIDLAGKNLPLPEERGRFRRDFTERNLGPIYRKDFTLKSFGLCSRRPEIVRILSRKV